MKRVVRMCAVGAAAMSIMMSSAAASAADQQFAAIPHFVGETSPSIYWNPPVANQSF